MWNPFSLIRKATISLIVVSISFLPSDLGHSRNGEYQAFVAIFVDCLHAKNTLSREKSSIVLGNVADENFLFPNRLGVVRRITRSLSPNKGPLRILILPRKLQRSATGRADH